MLRNPRRHALGVCALRDTVLPAGTTRSGVRGSWQRSTRRRHRSIRLAAASGLVVVGVALTSSWSVQAADSCTPAIARVVSIQGNVELRRAGAGRSQAAGWQAAELDVALCAGDTVRTEERSRAALLLSNETTLRLDQRSTLTLAPPDDARVSLVDLVTGALHVITRTSRPFKVKTPFVNANVEGTEFLVIVGGESASVAVYEGTVTADNERGSVAITAGERAIAARNSAPRKEVVVRPRDAVQWALYFPTLFDYRRGAGIAGAPAEAALQESVELYRKGRLADAIGALENAPAGSRSPRFLIYRAGLLLLVGRVDEARPDIQRAVALDPRNSDAYSVQAVVAVVENDKDLALSLANKAVELDPASPTARIALSYALQAQFKIELARASAQEAADLDPQNALAWARLAELEMSAGNLDRALDAAKHAAALSPELAKTQTVLGFAYLTRIETQAAKAAFERAIGLDNADPLPRLGLGLAKIRDGDLEGGRQEIEIATSLDPGTSLIRSYLGKAYYEEKRAKLAGTQFSAAKERDPKDPTPWFYDAILEQASNRPVEALEDLQKSIELNDNRAVYRSQLLLDQDLAARGASLATIYSQLGFEQLALATGYASLNSDPRNYSAHRFLADAYASEPRYEIARSSELLQALLRGPLNVIALDPQLADDRTNAAKATVLKGVGPGQPGFNEFNRLFESNGVWLTMDGVIASENTRGDEIVVSGIRDNVSFAVGQFYYDSDGFGSNADLRKSSYDAFIQTQLTDKTSIQAEFRYQDSKRGETFFAFDPDLIEPHRQEESTRNTRFGLHHTFDSRSDIVFSAIYQVRDLTDALTDDSGAASGRNRDLMGELQYVHAGDRYKVVAGLGHFEGDTRITIEDDSSTTKSWHDNAYVYGFLNPIPELTLILGLGEDVLHSPNLRRTLTSPKLGIIWNPLPATSVRLAAFRSLRRQFISNQTIEPTQVAGFNQLFDDANGTISRRFGIAIDQRFNQGLYGGFELSKRDLRVPVLSQSSFEDFDWREKAARAYMYWAIPASEPRTLLPGWSTTLSAEYRFTRFQRPEEFTGREGIADLKTNTVPIALTLNSQNGFSFRLVSTYVKQNGMLLAFVGANSFPRDERFWVADGEVAYLLSRRLGLVTLGVKNLFNKSFQFQETDPITRTFVPERFVFGKISLWF